jgi:hypothetical protein
LALPILSEEERQLIISAKIAIRRARFQNLQRQINKLQASVKAVQVAPAVQADKLIAILRDYPLAEQAEKSATVFDARAIDTQPDIILSESFDNPPRL